MSDRLLGIPTATAAEWFIIGSSVISLIVLLTFGSFLRSLYDGSNELLALSCYSQYERFTIAMSGCVLLVGAACLRVVPWLRARNARTTSILLARWGGLVIVVALLLLMAAPWRLYYDNDKPRAVLNGRPVYILAEEADDLVLYDATLRTTQHYHRTAIPELTRLGTDGYVFEHEEGCSDGSR